MQKTFDAVVLGLGGMGSAAAAQLAARGARVLGLERYGALHNLGSSHGASRIIRQAYLEHPNYVPLVLRSYELWRRLERDSEEELLHITGGLFIGAWNSDAVRGSLHSASLHGLPVEVLTPAETLRRFPAFHLGQDEAAVYEANAGFVRPERAIAANLALATRYGAELHFNEPVLRWEGTSTGAVRVTTADGAYEAAKLVLAPGAWAPDIFSGSELPLVVRRHVMAWFDPPGGLDLLLPGRFPIYFWQSAADRIFYGFPAIDGPCGGAKVAIHTEGDLCTPASINRTITAQDEQELRELIASRIPALNGRLLTASTCMYTLTPDEHFVVGLHPDHSNVVLACGFSGHGFKFAAVVGEVVADLVLEGETLHSIEFLSPGRFRTAPAEKSEAKR